MKASSSTPKPIQRILLDCTHTHATHVKTGIQRVVRNIARAAKHLAPEMNIECRPVVLRKGQYELVKVDIQQENVLWETTKRVYRAVMSPLISTLPLPILKRWLLPAPGHCGIFKIPVKIGKAIAKPVRKLLEICGLRERPLVEPGAGDMLMIMEPNSYQKNWHIIEQIKARGAKVGTLMFDLIPITHAECCDPRCVREFVPWLAATAQHSDFYIAISWTVRNELEAHLNRHFPRPWRSEQFEAFHLGADLDLVSHRGGVRASVQSFFAGHQQSPIDLFVGTVEPRKNHEYLLDAYELAWQAGSPAKLCLIGRVGWLCEQTLERIQQHPELGQRLQCYHDLSDTELNYCYERARALVYPSKQEGFGLPLIEALHKKLKVLASDIPIHREVGQDFCAYFDLRKPQDLATKLAALDRHPGSLGVRDPAEYEVVSWEQSCREFLTACIRQGRANSLGDKPVTQTRAA